MPIPSVSPPPRRQFAGLTAAVFTLTLISAAFADGGTSATPRLTIQRRAVNQDQGGWLVDYRLRYDGPNGMVLTPTDVLAKVDGWVSNSRVSSHAIPRLSSLVISGPSGLASFSEVISSPDEAQRCRERLFLTVWTGDAGPPESPPGKPTAGLGTSAAPLLSVAPGDTIHARLRWEHQHFLFGDYDPLLGQRTIELRLGAATVRDVLPMDHEQYLALPKFVWPAPPEDRRDTRYYLSPPDSLHLEAHVPGNQYYRFPERPVRYSTKMRLRFWYLTAPGTEGECRARIQQYKDTPAAWKVLDPGAHEECLSAVGRWVKVEYVFRTEPDATTLALDFRISGADVGEMWIDNVSLEPVGATLGGP